MTISPRQPFIVPPQHTFLGQGLTRFSEILLKTGTRSPSEPFIVPPQHTIFQGAKERVETPHVMREKKEFFFLSCSPMWRGQLLSHWKSPGLNTLETHLSIHALSSYAFGGARIHALLFSLFRGCLKGGESLVWGLEDSSYSRDFGH